MYEMNKDGEALYIEYLRDFENIQENVARIRGGKPYKALRRSGATFPKNIITKFTTPRGNRYLMMSMFRSRSDVFAKLQTESLAALVIQPDGRYRAMVFPMDIESGKTVVVEYTPHLFEQYADRMNTDKRGVSLIEEFFSRNCYLMAADGFTRPGDDNAVMMTCNDGACFGKFEEGKTSLITFIASNTMQYGYKSQFDRKHNEVTTEALEGTDLTPTMKRKFVLRNETN